MVKNFNHQKTIGIVGVTPDSQAFILKANQLGFETYLLCRTREEASLIFGVNEVFIGTLEEEAIRDNFLMQCDLLVYYDETLNATDLEDTQKMVVVPQGDDLLSIAQDRVLQKAFLDSLSVNIAPYVTVVKAEDIEEGIRSIGYPAVLRTNQVNPESRKQSFFIYEESDIEEAATLLKYGTCVLESWLVSEEELSISAVKTGNGELKLFPIIKKEYRNERLFNVQVPANLNQELIDEIKRVTHVILENIDFRGVATIDFMVTPANALYVGNIYPYPNILTRYSEDFCTLSATEAHLRAITSLPIPTEISCRSPYIFAPFYVDQKEKIDELISVQPNWKFSFYPITKKNEINTQEAVGHMLIETDDVKKSLAALKDEN
jgi:5-(carboxyamino)imidazole ribonucleotide synthase